MIFSRISWTRRQLEVYTLVPDVTAMDTRRHTTLAMYVTEQARFESPVLERSLSVPDVVATDAPHCMTHVEFAREKEKCACSGSQHYAAYHFHEFNWLLSCPNTV